MTLYEATVFAGLCVAAVLGITVSILAAIDRQRAVASLAGGITALIVMVLIAMIHLTPTS